VKADGDKMKKQFFNYVLILMFSTCFVFKAGAQSIQAEARLQQYTIRIGDQTKLFFSVHQPAKEHVNFPKLKDTITGKVQIVSINKPDTTVDKNDPKNITVIQSYTITGFDAGTYTIPSFSFGTTGGVLKTNELTLQVETVKVDTTKAIYDIKKPLAVSYTFFDELKDNWDWIAISLSGVLLIGGLIWYFLKRPKKEIKIEIVKPGLPAHITALNQLNELREKKLWQQGEVKQYYIELSDVLREYLEKRYAVKTHEKTTDEIFVELRHVAITQENKNTLRQILSVSDLVKFAKEQPLPPENEQNINKAIDFVLKTQQAELAESTERSQAHV
jgi:hypothetical protein